ncbi:MAG TPA: hypothetical protein DCP92_16590 [Nitrospiraceae bacterium]|jgi:hypothetical protein|nr:hypothetical protein [Nitrospiraceae bacterium]
MTLPGVSSQQYESFVPVYDVIPEHWEMARQQLVEQLKKITNQLNACEIGWFLDQEVVAGKNLFPGTTASTNQNYRTVLRKVFATGALPNNTQNKYAHGIIVNANFTLITMYGGASNPSGTFPSLPMPYTSITAGRNVQLDMDQTYIYITTAFNYSGYTQSFVVVEYTQEL